MTEFTCLGVRHLQRSLSTVFGQALGDGSRASFPLGHVPERFNWLGDVDKLLQSVRYGCTGSIAVMTGQFSGGRKDRRLTLCMTMSTYPYV